MKKRIIILLLGLVPFADLFGMNYQKPIGISGPESIEARKSKFRRNIPLVAGRFIGIPYKYGGNPQISGTTDNSYLFYSIYTQAARKAGLAYHGYLPMKKLMENCKKIKPNKVQSGDLMLLKNGLAAMVFRVESSGRIHLIYASKKRNQVFSFNSDNLVFQVYWMENFKGFYTLSPHMVSKQD